MFENIGGKIKALAKVVCWLGIIASIISGLVMIVAGSGSRNGGSLVASGFAVMIGGSLVSWIGSFVTYGFGELVENSCIQTELAVKKAMQEENQKSKSL